MNEEWSRVNLCLEICLSFTTVHQKFYRKMHMCIKPAFLTPAEFVHRKFNVTAMVLMIY